MYANDLVVMSSMVYFSYNTNMIYGVLANMQSYVHNNQIIGIHIYFDRYQYTIKCILFHKYDGILKESIYLLICRLLYMVIHFHIAYIFRDDMHLHIHTIQLGDIVSSPSICNMISYNKFIINIDSFYHDLSLLLFIFLIITSGIIILL